MAASAPPGGRGAMSFAMKRRPGTLAQSILKRRASTAPHRGRVSHPRVHRSRGVGRGGGALPQERERRDQPRTVRQIAERGLIEEPVGSNDGDPPVTTPGVAQHHQVFSQAGPER